MDTNVIVCPDVHCRDFYKPVLNIKDKQIVFLGDYLDPYPWEDVTFRQGIENLKEIIQFKKNNPDRVTLLWGNHDFNYIWRKNWATRFDPHFCKEVHQIYMENFDLFEPYKIIDDILFTHAGVSKGWYNLYKIENIKEFLDTHWKAFLNSALGVEEEAYFPIFNCGRIRGGYSKYGGIFWNDVRELDYENPTEYIQIFGHTQLTLTGDFIDCIELTPSFKGKNMYCCDSRAIFEFKNNELKLYGN